MTKTAAVIAGRYEIGELIGSGGMGEVYRAHDKALQRTVALKLLPPAFSMDEERVRRFLHEARAASSLNHPNILTIHDVGEGATGCFMATELVEGETLRQRLARTRLTLPEVLDIAIQVSAGLTVAHQAGIVHRDIKPENVMLRSDGIVKLLDFGLAKVIERAGDAQPDAATVFSSDTDIGLIMGTVTYMSPEQARGLKVDARTDAFSFGVMLYEMIAGQPPFSGGTASDVMVSILEREPQPIRSQARIPAQLEWIVAKALEKNPDLRYQTVADLRVDLIRLQKAIESGRLVEPEPASLPEPTAPTPSLNEEDPRVVRFSRFSRGSAALAAAAAVAAIALWPLYRAGNPVASLRVDLPRAAVPVKAREVVGSFGYDATGLVDNVHFSATALRLSDTVNADGIDGARRAIGEGLVAKWRDVLAKERLGSMINAPGPNLKPGQYAVEFDPRGHLTSFTTPPREAESTAELSREEAIAKGEELARSRLAIDPRVYDLELVRRSDPPRVVELTWRQSKLLFGHRDVARVQFQGSRVTAVSRSLQVAQEGSEAPGSAWVKTADKILTPVLITLGIGMYAFGLASFFVRRRWDALVDRLPLTVTLLMAVGLGSTLFYQSPGVLEAVLAIAAGFFVAAAVMPAAAGLVLWMRNTRPDALYGFDQLVRGSWRSRAASAAVVHGCLGGLALAGLSAAVHLVLSKWPGQVPSFGGAFTTIDFGVPLPQALTQFTGAIMSAVLMTVIVEVGTKWLRSPIAGLACAAVVFGLGQSGGAELTVSAAAGQVLLQTVVGAAAAFLYYRRGFGALVIAFAARTVVQQVLLIWSLGESQLAFQANVLVAIGVAVFCLGVWGYVGDRLKQSLAGVAAKPAG